MLPTRDFVVDIFALEANLNIVKILYNIYLYRNIHSVIVLYRHRSLYLLSSRGVRSGAGYFQPLVVSIHI